MIPLATNNDQFEKFLFTPLKENQPLEIPATKQLIFGTPFSFRTRDKTVLSTSIQWLLHCDNEDEAIFKKIIMVFAAFILALSLAGIPLLILAFREYHLEKKEQDSNNQIRAAYEKILEERRKWLQSEYVRQIPLFSTENYNKLFTDEQAILQREARKTIELINFIGLEILGTQDTVKGIDPYGRPFICVKGFSKKSNQNTVFTFFQKTLDNPDWFYCEYDSEESTLVSSDVLNSIFVEKDLP